MLLKCCLLKHCSQNNVIEETIQQCKTLFLQGTRVSGDSNTFPDWQKEMILNPPQWAAEIVNELYMYSLKMRLVYHLQMSIGNTPKPWRARYTP